MVWIMINMIFEKQEPDYPSQVDTDQLALPYSPSTDQLPLLRRDASPSLQFSRIFLKIVITVFPRIVSALE